MITCLIPAHNEEVRVGAAIDSIKFQVDRVLVVADNCTDSTASVAVAHGAQVVATVGNELKKGGALNQVLLQMLRGGPSNDFFMILDADSQVNDTFVHDALSVFRDPKVGAVGGIFYGEPGGGLIGQFQRNEYFRYAHDIAYRKYRAMVITGTAGIFRASVLAHVVEGRRNGTLPRAGGDVPVGVFDTAALTEDRQRTHARSQNTRLHLHLPSGLSRHHGGYADVESLMEAALSLDARSHRELDGLRLHKGHGSLLVTAVRPVHRGHRSWPVLDLHVPRHHVRSVDSEHLAVAHADLYRRARVHRPQSGLEGHAARCADLSGDHLRHGHLGHVRVVRGRCGVPSQAGMAPRHGAGERLQRTRITDSGHSRLLCAAARLDAGATASAVDASTRYESGSVI